MAHGVPFLFEGPTKSRFYFIGGDHWAVHSDEEGVAASLRQKQYSWRRYAIAYLMIPGLIAAIGILLYLVTAKPEVFWAFLTAAIAAGLPMAYIHRTEHNQLSSQPNDTFILRLDGTVEIQSEAYELQSISDLTLEYTFFQSTGAQGDGGYSELDVVIATGEKNRRINLLSQTSNWALRHARALERTGIKLKRNSVAR